MSLMTQINTSAIVFSVWKYQNDITKSVLLLFKCISIALQDDEFMQRKEKAIKTVNEISVSVKYNALVIQRFFKMKYLI